MDFGGRNDRNCLESESEEEGKGGIKMIPTFLLSNFWLKSYISALALFSEITKAEVGTD